jgi:quercetin dioxygenase-like cupin family protein
MSTVPVVVNERERAWSTWPAHQLQERGEVWWRTLISAGCTQTRELSLGIARVDSGAALRPHRHTQSEIYLVLDGAGDLTIDGTTRRVGPGDAVFIPGGTEHGICCAGPSELRFAYVFPADSTDLVEYDFSAGPG